MLSTISKTATWLAVVLIMSFGFYVLFRAKSLKSSNLEQFLTARKSIPAFTLGWSFFASAMGSWVITGPAQFGFYVGTTAAVAYAFAAAIPIIFIAFFGGSMTKLYPEILSMSDFVRWRFGPVTQVLTICITLLNMSVAIIAEYSTLMSLYSDFVGLGNDAAYIVILVSVVTLTYTTYGGLKASIVTDKVQGVVALYLVQVILIFLLADFKRSEIEEDSEEQGFNASFEFTEFVKGTTDAGWGTFFTLPVSLTTATIYSEALWQRSWAAMDQRTLNIAAVVGAVLIFIVVGFFGGLGVVVAWAGMVPDPFAINQNLFAFQVFSEETGRATVGSAIGVLVLLLGSTMAESAIDSLQNGIGAAFNGAILRYFREKGEGDAAEEKIFNVSRVLLVVVNAVYVIIGLQEYSVLSLFLLGNMICISAFFPICLGFFPDQFYTPYLRDFVPPISFVVSMGVSVVYAAVKLESFSDGLDYAFWSNINYEWPYFLAALLGSFASTGLVMVFSAVLLGPKSARTLQDQVDLEAFKVEQIEEEEVKV